MLPNCDDSTACLPWSHMAGSRSVRRTRGRSWNCEILIAAPVNLDVQVANLLPQRVAVEAQQVGGANLVTPGRRQRGRQQGHLDFLENPMIEARRRYPVRETGKMRCLIDDEAATE